MNIKKGRVTSAGEGSTPVNGNPKAKPAGPKGTRQGMKSEMSRQGSNPPDSTKGFPKPPVKWTGTRVTSKETRVRGAGGKVGM